MSEAYPDYDELRIEADQRRQAMLASRRSFAAWRICTTLTVLEALLAGRPVRVELLAEPYRSRLPFWGGFLDDAAALDVVVLDEQLRIEAEQTPATPPATSRRSERRPSLRELGAQPIERSSR